MSQPELTFTPAERPHRFKLAKIDYNPFVSGNSRPTFTPLATDAVGSLRSIFPNIRITSGHRGPGGAGFASDYHHTSHAAVDAAMLPGMTFDQFKAKIEAAGYPIIEALDEAKHPNKYTTGPHWHVVLGERKGSDARRPGELTDNGLYFTPNSERKLTFTPKPKKAFTHTRIDYDLLKALQGNAAAKGHLGHPACPQALSGPEIGFHGRPTTRHSSQPRGSASRTFRRAWNTTKGIDYAIAHPAEVA